MKRKIDIHKAAGTIIVNRRLLVERSRGEPVFVHPGGKLEPGETSKQALVRELKEEFTIDVREQDLDFFGTFYAEAARQPGRWLRMDVYNVTAFSGTIQAAAEVDEIAFITSDIPPGMEVGSICRHEILPRLKALDVID